MVSARSQPRRAKPSSGASGTPAVAIIVNDYVDTGRYDDALDVYPWARTIQRDGRDRRGTAVSNRNIGSVRPAPWQREGRSRRAGPAPGPTAGDPARQQRRRDLLVAGRRPRGHGGHRPGVRHLVRFLVAADTERARSLLSDHQTTLAERARRIRDDAMRASCLDGIPSNRTLRPLTIAS